MEGGKEEARGGGRKGGNEGGSQGGSDDAMQGESVSGGRQG